MFLVQIKTAVLKKNTVFWAPKRSSIHIYVNLLSCKSHNDYKFIEI